MDPQVGQSLDGPSFVSAPNFVSVTPSLGVLFPILRIFSLENGIISSKFALKFVSISYISK
jgi:hypothetical protein